ncbi:MAG TPA: hypothetical protein VFE62_16075 [Gemmataceae bacterium]|nr:hypothetical protein [Gemmataceae bacterium]
MASVKRDKSGGFQKLDLALKQLSGIQTKTGWFPGAKYEDGTPVALAAAANEFGHGKTPARAFFRPTIAEQEKIWRQDAANGARAVLKGAATGHDVMDALGERAQEDVKQTINQITSPPLSPVTLELRAMKRRDPARRITGKTVGEAAARVHEQGYKLASGTPDKPLINTKLLITTLTHITESA